MLILYVYIQLFSFFFVGDTLFEKGEMVERFSQKDYLVRWHLRDNQLHPSLNTDISAITTIETDPVNGTVYTAAVSVNDSSIPADKTGDLIRAHMDLYGWMFRPNLDDQGRTVSVDTQFVCNLDLAHAVPKTHLEKVLDASMQSIDNLQKYLNQYGCPPYIRRVAGKVMAESFNALTNEYRMVYTVKHQPSNSYRSRKRRDTNHWCTDIRIHKDMFPHGLDVHVLPDNLVRCEVLVKHQMIKIFTIDPSVDGKEVTLTLKPLLKDDDTFDYTTYKYNDTLFTSIKEKEEKKETKTSSTEQANQPSSEEVLTKQVDEDIKIPKGYLLVPERQVCIITINKNKANTYSRITISLSYPMDYRLMVNKYLSYSLQWSFVIIWGNLLLVVAIPVNLFMLFFSTKKNHFYAAFSSIIFNFCKFELAAVKASFFCFCLNSACFNSSVLMRVIRANYSIILIFYFYSKYLFYLFGVVKTFKVIITLRKTLLRKISRSIALVKFLPKVEASTTT